MKKPTIAIIGPGRAGSALARSLHQAGYRIAAISARHPDRAQELIAELEATLTGAAAAISTADLTILAIPDDAIGPLARELAPDLPTTTGRAVLHLSGAQDRTPLEPFERAGVATAVFHAVQTFRAGPDAARNVKGTYFGIDADGELWETLARVARDLKGHPFDLRGVNRALYHAAAVFTANYATTLLAEATRLMERSGVDPKTAHPALVTLLAGAVNNLRHSSARAALTGPAARGDTGTIQRHLEALAFDPGLQQAYRLLADRTRTLAQMEAA